VLLSSDQPDILHQSLIKMCSSALYALWSPAGTIQENGSLLAIMRVEEVVFWRVVVTKEGVLPTMRSPLSVVCEGA
jgi:hypothetical protein